jgi:hypothetical protein
MWTAVAERSGDTAFPNAPRRNPNQWVCYGVAMNRGKLQSLELEYRSFSGCWSLVFGVRP